MNPRKPPTLKNAGSESRKLGTEDLKEVTWIVIFQVILLVAMYAAQAASEQLRDFLGDKHSLLGDGITSLLTTVMFTLRRYLKDYTGK